MSYLIIKGLIQEYMKNEKFNLTFKYPVFSKGDRCTNGIPYINTPWYLKILGFSIWHVMQVLGEPVLTGGNYVYDVKYVKSKLTWFKWTIKEY